MIFPDSAKRTARVTVRPGFCTLLQSLRGHVNLAGRKTSTLIIDETENYSYNGNKLKEKEYRKIWTRMV